MPPRKTKQELKFAKQVETCCQKLLRIKHYIWLPDLLMELNLLKAKDFESWRNGEYPYLEKCIQSNLPQINSAVQNLKEFIENNHLEKEELEEIKLQYDQFQFSKTGLARVERFYRTYFIVDQEK